MNAPAFCGPQAAPGRLESALRQGAFVVTAETTPPDSSDPADVLTRIAPLKGVVDAINVTDGAGARAHMSAFACAAVMARDGIEPVLQFTARDRNRLAIQGDLIGAATLGITNILCLHGDDPKNGDQPDAMPVYDLDSRGIIATAHGLNAGTLPSGRKVDPPTRLFIGAADSPRDVPDDWTPDGVLAKIDSGTQFFQTQYCFDVDVLRRYMARLGDHGVFERASFIIGIGPFASAKSARWMNDNLFGVNIPDAMIARLEGAADQRAEGRMICTELMQAFQEIDGVSGAHFMAPRQEESIAMVVAESGVVANRRALV